MSISLAKGRVTISDTVIAIKKPFSGAEVIQKHKITSVEKSGNILLGIWNCIWIINILTGIQMLLGKKIITIESTSNTVSVWMSKEDYNTLQANL